MTTREKYEFERQHPRPGDDPEARLRHVNDLFRDQRGDDWAILATSNAYPEDGRTGLTWGDLRELAARLGGGA